jgi:hypothetical protein
LDLHCTPLRQVQDCQTGSAIRAEGSNGYRSLLDSHRLWHAQGKMQQARELLAPVYGWFTEGFDTRDLKEAV